VLDSLKAGRSRRRKNDKADVDVLDMITSFITKMELAAEEDRAANINEQLAVNKVKMLSEAVTQLEK
jgi:hypothetical protein